MQSCENELVCGSGRREFLAKATTLAGGLILSLSGTTVAQKEPDKPKMPANGLGNSDEVILKFNAKSPLGKIGGSDTFDTAAGKVVVVRIGDMDFKAFAAVCPHKGGPINYDEKTSQLFCPWHGSRFDANGKVIKGPAKSDLPPYQAEEAVIINLKTKA